MRCLLTLLLLYSWCRHLYAAEAEVESSKTSSGCAVSHQRLNVIYRELFSEELTVYVNCLSFDLTGALESGIVSGVNEANGANGLGDSRLVLSCMEDVIIIKPSTETPLALNMTSTACLSCADNPTPCSEGK